MIRKAALALSALFLAFLAIGLLLPGEIRVQRSIEIAAPPETVFPLVDDLREFNRWSPWQAAGVDFSFSGPESGVGARMVWTEPDGRPGGGQEIVVSQPPRRVVYGLEFGPRGGAEASMELESSPLGTRVTWGFDYRVGYDMVGRYIGALTQGRVGEQYALGLTRLKALAETGEASP